MTGSPGVNYGIIYYTGCTSIPETQPVEGGDSGTFCATQGEVILDYDNISYTYPNFGSLITEGSSCTPCDSGFYCGICPSPTQTPTITKTPTTTN
jgi:hypothetical protein